MADKMTSRVVTQSVTVVRDGKRVSPPLHKAFKFTAEEIAYLDEVSPSASRKAVNETPVEELEQEPKGGDTGDDASAPDQNAKPTAARTLKRGAAAKKAAAKTDDADADADAEEADAGADADSDADAGESEDDDI